MQIVQSSFCPLNFAWLSRVTVKTDLPLYREEKEKERRLSKCLVITVQCEILLHHLLEKKKHIKVKQVEFSLGR